MRRGPSYLGACLGLLMGMTAVPLDASAQGDVHPLCAAREGRDVKLLSIEASGLCAVIETAGKDGQPRDVLADPVGRASHDQLPGLAAADFVLLGEVHDNPVHHRSRAGLLGKLNGRTWRPEDGRASRGPNFGLIMEHIRADQQEAVSGITPRDGTGRDGRSAKTYLDVLEWEKSGWPERKLFEPIFSEIFDLVLPVYAGNPTRAEVRDVARKGVAALPERTLQELGLLDPLPPAAQDGLLGELEASHCGLMPKRAFAGMADAQRFRDAFMAKALVGAQSKYGHAVLLAGNGHVRRDRGVPWHLSRMAAGKTIVVIMYVEVASTGLRVEDYVERDAAGRPVADFVFVTTQVARPDPCEEMRKHFKR